jgi:hypothetical protein
MQSLVDCVISIHVQYHQGDNRCVLIDLKYVDTATPTSVSPTPERNYSALDFIILYSRAAGARVSLADCDDLKLYDLAKVGHMVSVPYA